MLETFTQLIETLYDIRGFSKKKIKKKKKGGVISVLEPAYSVLNFKTIDIYRPWVYIPRYARGLF